MGGPGGGYGGAVEGAGGGYGPPGGIVPQAGSGGALVPSGWAGEHGAYSGGSVPVASPPVSVRSGVQPRFEGRGGELFVTFLAGYVLSIITLGIYAPWFYCRLTDYVTANTTLGPTRHGAVHLTFTGRGAPLLVTLLLGCLLTILTVGIYGAWFTAKLIRFFTDNTTAVAADGTRFRLRFEATGGQLLTTVLLGYLLTIVTMGIYGPWFYCKLQKLIASRTTILENEQPVGSFDFVGHGGELFIAYLLGYLITIVSMGLYAPWFAVTLMRFGSENSRVYYKGRAFAGNFHGVGGELFVIVLVGYLLSIVTVGIYFPWFLVRLWKFQLNHRDYVETPDPGMPVLAAHGLG